MLILVFFGLTFYLSDILEIGTKKILVRSAARTAVETAMIRSVEEGGIRTKHQPRIDVNVFYDELYQWGMANAGKEAMENPYTDVYKVERLKPYAAVQFAREAHSKSMKWINENKTYNPRHRVIYIWDNNPNN
jgi:hypothetical protein